MPRQGQPPLIIGHRGHADALENTLISFREAIEQGAQMVELDTRLSKDGVPIVFHDSLLKRITGKRGALRERTARYLTSLDLGDGFRLSTLEDTLAELTPRIPVNVELKYNELVEYRPLATAVCEVIQKLGVERRILISSFHHQALRMVEKLLPEVAVAPLMGCLTGPPHADDLESVFARKTLKRPPDVYPFQGPAAVVWNPMIDEALAEKFAKARATLLTYTVDEPAEMKRLIALGIDGIITNRPGVLAGLLDELFP